MRPVTEKREKTHLKGSKYDPIIDQFIQSGHNLVEISVEDKKAGYIASNLKKRTRHHRFGGRWLHLPRKELGKLISSTLFSLAQHVRLCVISLFLCSVVFIAF